MNFLLILLTLMHPSLQKDKVVINKEYEISNPEKMTVIIDNIHGDVEVEATAGNKLYLALEIHISAHTDELMAQAKRDLKLGQLLTDDSLVFFTKAPFVEKCKWGSSWGYNMKNQPEYAFTYKYKLKVPKQVALEAKTVNNGQISVTNMEGPVRVSNVNGSIEVQNVHDLRKATTVNGDVDITFAKAPSMPVDFNTVNGDFTFQLPENFSAKVYFNSMNGDLYSSFDYERLSPRVEKSEENGKFKIGTKTGVEIGSGGPELSFKSINGNVYLKKKNN